jgi:hypothetical protein
MQLLAARTLPMFVIVPVDPAQSIGVPVWVQDTHLFKSEREGVQIRIIDCAIPTRRRSLLRSGADIVQRYRKPSNLLLAVSSPNVTR